MSDFKKVALAPPKKLNKRGRPSLHPEEIINKTIQLVKALRLKGAPISTTVITSIAKGIIEANDRTILVENGGYLTLNNQSGQNVLYRIRKDGKKMTWRKGTTDKIPVSPGLIKEAKLNYQRMIKQLQSWHDIPDDLIINFDQTSLSYVSASNHTLEVQGATSVPLIGKGKKKQITGTFAVTKSGLFLPMQIIYQGKTERGHPQDFAFPPGFNITQTKNHWSNEDKVIEHLETLIFPYAAAKKEELGIPDHQKALLIYDVFKGQKTRKVLDLIEANHCVNVYVPANLTHVFQVLDLTINGVAKSFLTRKFGERYAEQVTQQMAKGIDVYDVKVDTNLTVMKPVHAKWLVGLYDHLRNSSDLILKGGNSHGLGPGRSFCRFGLTKTTTIQKV